MEELLGWSPEDSLARRRIAGRRSFASFVRLYISIILVQCFCRCIFELIPGNSSDIPSFCKHSEIGIFCHNGILVPIWALKQNAIDHCTEMAWYLFLWDNICVCFFFQLLAIFPFLIKLFWCLHPQRSGWRAFRSPCRTRFYSSIQISDHLSCLDIDGFCAFLRFVKFIKNYWLAAYWEEPTG